MKKHSHTSLFALAAWLVVGCGSNLNIGDPEPTPAPTAPTGTTASPEPTPAPTSSSPAPPSSSSLVPCATGTLCWANTESTRNDLVSTWASDAARSVWSVTRHGEILHWDGVYQTLRFRIDGTFDDALVLGTAADNVYAFFHRAKTPAEPFGATTVVRFHDGAFQVHASSGAYAIGALRPVQVPKLGIVAVLSKANDPASVALVDADLKPQLVLPALPIASELAARVDETFDATASVNAVNVLSVWVLTKTGRVFRWTEGGAAWDEIRPFPPTSVGPGEYSELSRGTGIATRGEGVQVIRDTWLTRTGNIDLGYGHRAVATLEGSGSVVTSIPRGVQPEEILPHGRSVTPGYGGARFVGAGGSCGGLGCGWWGTILSQWDNVWTRFELPIDAGFVLGDESGGLHTVGTGGQLYTRLSTPNGSIDANWVRREGRSPSDRVFAIDALADDDVWALESREGTHRARHYDGRTWSEGVVAPGRSGAPSRFVEGVDEAPPGDTMVALKDSVWFKNSEVLSRWKGGGWTTFSLGAPVSRLAKDGPDSLWAVSQSSPAGGGVRVARLHRWDGTAWSDLGSPFAPNEDIRGLAAAGGVVWATGDAIYRREGARTDTIVCSSLPTGTAYSAVFAVGDEAWVVASLPTPGARETALLHIAGTRCMVVGTPPGEQLSIRNVVGVRASDAWVVATTTVPSNGNPTRDRTEPRLFRWNGRTLEPAKLAVDPRFVSASVSPLGTLWVGGTHGAILRSAVPKPN
ncbi:MAG: hypothetical protein IPQ09_16685 [Myxococcales bacterium]|nr:hypothetical protein [Myxococcales bacterium]